MTQRRARTGAVLGAGVLLLAACAADGGTATALADEAFAACAESAGVPAPADDLSAQEQLDFWAEPGALRCAVDELDGPALTEALAGGFQDPDDADDYAASAKGQQAAVRQLVLDVVEGGGEPDDAYRAVAEVLEAGWWEEAEADTLLLREIASLAVVEGTEGLPAYDDYLARADQEDSPGTYTYFLDQVRGAEPERLAVAVREGPQRINDFR